MRKSSWILGLAASALGVSAGEASAATCAYRIDNPGHGSVSTSSQRIDSRTVEQTTTTVTDSLRDGPSRIVV